MGRNRIAIIDNDPAVLDSLGTLVDVHGLVPRTFTSAAEFLTATHLCPYACMVVDIFLPYMNGIDFVRHLRDSGTNIPTIFITGNPADDIELQARRVGGLAFMAKPFDPMSLMQLIQQSAP